MFLRLYPLSFADWCSSQLFGSVNPRPTCHGDTLRLCVSFSAKSVGLFWVGTELYSHFPMSRRKKITQHVDHAAGVYYHVYHAIQGIFTVTCMHLKFDTKRTTVHVLHVLV